MSKDNTSVTLILQHAYMALIWVMSLFTLGMILDVLFYNPQAKEIVLLMTCALVLIGLFEIHKARIEYNEIKAYIK